MTLTKSRGSRKIAGDQRSIDSRTLRHEIGMTRVLLTAIANLMQAGRGKIVASGATEPAEVREGVIDELEMLVDEARRLKRALEGNHGPD